MSSIVKHCLDDGHWTKWYQAKVLARERSGWERKIKEGDFCRYGERNITKNELRAFKGIHWIWRG